MLGLMSECCSSFSFSNLAFINLRASLSHVSGVSEVKSALVGTSVGSILQVDHCVSSLQLLFSELSPVLLRGLDNLCVDGDG